MKNDEKNDGMISVMINICTRVVTIIFIMITIFRKAFDPAGTIILTLKDIWGVILIGVVSGLGFGIFYIKKDKSNRLLFLCKLLYFLIINATLWIVGLNIGWFKKEISSIVIMEVMFVLVFFFVSVLVYLLDFNEAKKINKKLKDRKNSITKNTEI